MTIAKRPPSLELPNIRELYEKAGWPEDGHFRADQRYVVLPDGHTIGPMPSVWVQYIVEACEYWNQHLRGGADREQARLRRVAAAKGQTP